MNKRSFLKMTGLGLGTLGLSGLAGAAQSGASSSHTLSDITGSVEPISVAERRQRIKTAQKLMAEQGVSAMILEPGAAMDYFSGIQWWRSERLTALVVPQEGEPAVVTPFFEEPSVRESMAVGSEVRVWQEHQSPFERVKELLTEWKLDKGKLAFENSVRYFVLSEVMALLPGMTHVSAEPVTRGCRMYKSAHELALMHKANEVTLKAYEHVYGQLTLGMSQSDVKALMDGAQQRLGGKGTWNMALFNEASAYPHGTRQSQEIQEGSLILMDCGCNVHGYQSDISRTFVFGEPSKKQHQVWKSVRKGQQIAFEKAQIGVAAGQVDKAVRDYYQTLGYGPEYALPGLSHRTGHGIGMEGHESVNFVLEEITPLKPGMCFSDEPGIYIPGEFGVRLEDCLYMTEQGPQWFTVPPASLEEPIGTLAEAKFG
ncbi:aminopeptidase P family protein [Alteromonas aestuariivivens]|uniref:Aminopeptidase P family protein n=1 Tax=Alteromonas aestuariivivens TaxID=1938339 RepID=A0A3D8MEC2_9ALTE|nr:Xaa-Pro peptidase family protein [Alteromonas aestuariivivens]RDV29103.1 aminopeptidase P family protein [Alteromonas aestuariivivens]